MLSFISHIVETRWNEPVFLTVMAGSMLVCGMSALIGVFGFLRKRSLLADVVAHAVLPGIALAFMISGSRSTLPLLVGGALSGALAAWLVDVVVDHSKLKPDAAIALNTSVFFGVGITLLTRIQHSGVGNQAGLDRFLFGKAASMQQSEVALYALILLIMVLMVGFFYRGFKLIAFDESYARSLGYPVGFLKLLLMFLTVLIVTAGVQSVGVVLMTALLVSPAAIGRFLSPGLKGMLFFALLSGIIAGATGAWISYQRPAMPTGPWIVVSLSTMALFSFVFAPRKGLLSRMKLQRQNQRRIHAENLIKSIFPLIESSPRDLVMSEKEWLERSGLSRSDFQIAIRKALKANWIERAGKGTYAVLETGRTASRSIVRKHRLWELYLNKYLHLDSSHVHDNAEGIEHVITPEIEHQLMEILDRPERDPHNSRIPY